MFTLKRNAKILTSALALATLSLALLEMAQAADCPVVPTAASIAPVAATAPTTTGPSAPAPPATTTAPVVPPAPVAPAIAPPVAGTPPAQVAPTPLAAGPSTVHLMTILADKEQRGRFLTYKMDLNLDASGDFLSARFYGRGENRTVSLAEVQAGVVIETYDGGFGVHNVLRLTGPSFDKVHGGMVVLQYMDEASMNPAGDKLSNYTMELKRSETGWSALSSPASGSKPLEPMILHTRFCAQYFGMPCGIEKIDP